GGKVYTGETEEGRNFIATQNIVRSAHEEAIRAHILTNTGKSPEELSGRDLMSARTDADMDLAGQQVDSSIIDKYLVPIGATNTPQPAATQAQAEPTQAPQPAATQAQAEPTQAPQPATEASPPVEAPPQTNAPAEDAAQTPEEPTPIDDKEDEAKKFDIEQGKAIAAGLSDYAGGAKDKKNQKKAEENEKGPPGPGIPGKPMQMPNIPKEEPATQGQQGVKTTQGGGQEAPVAKGRVTHAGPGGTRTKTRAPGINGKYKMSPQEEDPIRSPKIRTPEEPADSASAKTKKKTGKKIAVAAAVTGTAGLGKCMSASAASISMLNTIIDLLTQ
ncbi:MAG: hypothetical protein O3B47_00365, partial [bacterium]|nr:hypothetical protein [bacterium]